ncbi:DUF397 domain-containing protein [Streptomyces sp. RKAG293]|uniref:DUF397 domain-containing protein n=1 Tax=Streptomyces sp. RKAG293 TaxID=2893403 RepID=UPI002033B23F|nr:DUF397 domain-containing protein [Streptomyces sp. RKAG293]MCM2421847.1 DUF397 domain-containing protein [Streptomyces sp. RKAG293]
MNRAASPQRSDDDLAWFKSTHSGSEGGACVEIAYAWRKSSHSGSEGGNCIEVAAHPQAVHIRDSKDPDGPALTVSPAAWTRFVAFAAGADLSA